MICSLLYVSSSNAPVDVERKWVSAVVCPLQALLRSAHLPSICHAHLLFVEACAVSNSKVQTVPTRNGSCLLTFVPFWKRRQPELKLRLHTPRCVSVDYPV